MEFIFIGSSTVIAFFLLLILFKSEKSRADWLLAACFFIFLINSLGFYVLTTPSETPGIILELSDGLTFFSFPLAWFYAVTLTQVQYKFRWRDLLHFLPGVVSLSIFLSNFLFLHNPELESMRDYFSFLKLILMPIYCIFILLRIRKHQKLVPEIFSSIQGVNLAWGFQVMLGFLIIWFIAVISLVLYHFFDVDIPDYGGLYANLSMSILIILFCFYGIRQTQIFTKPISLNDKVQPEFSNTVNNKKYTHSGLTEQQAAELYKKITQFLEQHKIYLDPQLSLLRISDQTGIPTHHISQVINTYSHQNFFDFINQFRVDAVKEKIQDPENAHLTLLGIALESGFNSKASFNRAFKKFTGITPSEYRKALANPENK